MSRRLTAALAGLALAAVFAISFYRDRTQPKEYSTTWWDLFDTVTVVTGYAASEAEWQAQTDALYADLLRCHQLFDIYVRYDGLVNLADVNAQAAAGPVAVSDELMALLQFGKEAYEATGGACNIAAGTVLSLWHDAREAIQAAQAATGESAADGGELRALLPDGAALAQAAAHMDIDSLVLDEAAGTVFFADPQLKLDVGAIAKGWALEHAAQAAEARGLESALLNAGGSVRAIGTKPDGTRWTAGVRGLDEAYPPLAEVALEPGQSLIVSGDQERYFTLDGVRYHHLIDLQTLQPARYCRQIAVLGQDAGWGDALSTGLFCLAPEQGAALLDSGDTPGAAALWAFEDGRIQTSPGWPGQTG